MKIVLIGYMGSGKSTVGKLLSKKLKINFIDLDNFIESKLKSTVSTIFQEKGEIYFRKIEHKYILELMDSNEAFILSTGGGTPCYSNNMEFINAKTTNVFYLKVSISGLIERLVPEKEHRPLIKNVADENLPEFIGKHLFERNMFYLQAKHSIICDKKTPELIVTEIIDKLV